MYFIVLIKSPYVNLIQGNISFYDCVVGGEVLIKFIELHLFILQVFEVGILTCQFLRVQDVLFESFIVKKDVIILFNYDLARIVLQQPTPYLLYLLSLNKYVITVQVMEGIYQDWRGVVVQIKCLVHFCFKIVIACRYLYFVVHDVYHVCVVSVWILSLLLKLVSSAQGTFDDVAKRINSLPCLGVYQILVIITKQREHSVSSLLDKEADLNVFKLLLFYLDNRFV